MSEETIFTSDAAQQSYKEQLVGEGKKYSSEEELAKAYVNADKHIKGLEESYKELEEELKRRATAEELLQTIKAEKTNAPTAVAEPPPAKSPEVDFDTLKKEAAELAISGIKSQQEQEVQRQNVQRVSDRLLAKFKTQEAAVEYMQRVAQENDTDIAGIQELAKRNPKLAENLLGLNSQGGAKTPTPVMGDTRNDALNSHNSASEDTPEYWANMKANDPKLYFSAEQSRKRIQAKNRMYDGAPR